MWLAKKVSELNTVHHDIAIACNSPIFGLMHQVDAIL
jgi:hypothetical protein